METKILPKGFEESYMEDGLFLCPNFFDSATTSSLSLLVDALMLGERTLPGMFFQLDPNSKEYSNIDFSNISWSGPSLNYRKIKDLEYLPEFLIAIQNSPAKEIAEKLIGPLVSSMRTMVVNKPSKSQTPLPWHQDISNDWPMSGKPELTIWIALDQVDEENGCVEWVKSSHKYGVIDNGHLTTIESQSKYIHQDKILKGILNPGSAVVFNNGILHRSGPNLSGRRRRGLTICLMDGNITNTNTKLTYPIIFGSGALNNEFVAELSHVPKIKPEDFGE
jgi:hypothetical protein